MRSIAEPDPEQSIKLDEIKDEQGNFTADKQRRKSDLKVSSNI